ncbi:MAG: GNAT family N-acetyltransferase [Chitinophagales bacterium]
MSANKEYLFTSERLGFRNWAKDDVEIMADLNADAEVMEFFPAIQTKEQTLLFIERMQKEFAEKGFCYFAADRLDTVELIGFIGIHEQTFEADFTPFIDIGWRLKRNAWNQGFATEGAKRVLAYGFTILNLQKIYSFTPEINSRSENVMKKINMKRLKTFDFPLFQHNDRLRSCVLYEMKRESFCP